MNQLKFDPLQDGKSSLELIEFFGSDLSVVNDARVSFDRYSTEWNEKDERLLKYLIKHEHMSPLRGTVFKLRWKAPLSVCRQVWKHLIACSHAEEQIQHNEASFRYIEVKEEFYVPNRFRKQSTSNKQCSEGYLSDAENYEALLTYENTCHNSYRSYQDLIKLGVAREMARNMLVPAIYTSWINTISLQALLNMVTLRQGKGAQDEAQAYAASLSTILEAKVPYTYKYWKEFKLDK